MKATAEKIEKNTVMLEVEVEQDQFSKAVEKAYKNIVKKVNVPGFRKGKTPKVVLERYIGKEAFYEEAVELVVPDAYMKAIEDTGIEPVAQPEVELVQVEEGKPVVFKAKVVVKPEVILGQYVGIEATKEKRSITDEDVQQELERLQNRHAELISLEEGTVENKDVVSIDFEGKIDGVPFEGGQADNYSLEIGSNTFIPGFEVQVVGMQVGETKDLQVKFPENYGKEELNGKDAVFTVKVNLIKRKKLAALDDEFAKDVSEFDTLEELRTDIRNKLEKSAEDVAARALGLEVVAKAAKNAEMDIPPEMIDARVDEMVAGMNQRMLSQGMSLEMYLQYTNSNMDELKRRYRSDAEDNIQRDLVVEAIAKAENVDATEEEIDQEIRKMCEETKQEYDVVKKIIDKQGQLDFIKRSIIRDKVVQFMIDKAVVEEKELETAQK